MKFSLVFPAALAALVVGASFASADDTGRCPGAPPAKSNEPARANDHLLVFGDGAAKFNVERDPIAGRMTFRLADPAIRLDGAPVVVMTTDSGPREVTLTAVEGQPGVWVWSDDAVKTERFDGTMRVSVSGKAYTSPLSTVWTTEKAPENAPGNTVGANPGAKPSDAGWAKEPSDSNKPYGSKPSDSDKPYGAKPSDDGMKPVDNGNKVPDDSSIPTDANKPLGYAKPSDAHSRTHVLVFGDAARFNVDRDAAAGRMTFRLADPAVKLDSAPIIVMSTDSGPKEIALTEDRAQPGVWFWSGDPVKAERFDGTMRVSVAGRTYTSPLATVWTTETTDSSGDGFSKEPMALKARYGGRVLTLPACGTSVEVVQDAASGMLTIYSFDDAIVTEAPVITVTESTGPTVVTLTKVEGKNGAWMAKNDTFKRTTTSARIRLLVNGKPCEAPLIFGSGHGGQMVTVSGGPSFEVVRDPREGYYTFYAVDETFDGKAYTVENPTVVVSGRTYNLTPVEGEPRAWRLVGLDTAGSDARDAQLNFTLFGKTLSTRVGLNGIGAGVK